MKIKTTLGRILEICSSTFYKEIGGVKTDNIFAAYRIGNVIEAISQYYPKIQKFRAGMYEKYGTKLKDKDGNFTGEITPPTKDEPEKLEAFSKENEDFLGKDDYFDIPYPLDLNDIIGIGMKISPVDVIILMPLLDVEAITKLMKEQSEAAIKKAAIEAAQIPETKN